MKPGDEVVCVKAGKGWAVLQETYLVLGKVYIVEGYSEFGPEHIKVFGNDYYFSRDRFRPLKYDERWEDAKLLEPVR